MTRIKVLSLSNWISMFFRNSLLQMHHKNWLTEVTRYRSSRPEVFCNKGVLRNFSKFTGKRLCQSLFLSFFFFYYVFSCSYRTSLLAALEDIWTQVAHSAPVVVQVFVYLISEFCHEHCFFIVQNSRSFLNCSKTVDKNF